jgi:hypothetical protein
MIGQEKEKSTTVEWTKTNGEKALLILLQQNPILVADHRSLRTREKMKHEGAGCQVPYSVVCGLDGVSWSPPGGQMVVTTSKRSLHRPNQEISSTRKHALSAAAALSHK